MPTLNRRTRRPSGGRAWRFEPGSPALSLTAFTRWLSGAPGSSASASCTELAGRPSGAPEVQRG